MSLLPDDVKYIERATKDQADINFWLAMHNGRITSSRFAEILHRRPSTDSRRLAKEIMGYGKRMKICHHKSAGEKIMSLLLITK